tara:strand:+ start:196 stop:378 length:183 start_codon:yes stop_codon:yes gene_type:complete
MIGKISKYFVEIKREMGKVSWLNKQELRGSTIVVLVFSLIVVLFLFLIDLIISSIRGQIF